MEMHSVVSQGSHNGSEPARKLSSINHHLCADFVFYVFKGTTADVFQRIDVIISGPGGSTD